MDDISRKDDDHSRPNTDPATTGDAHESSRPEEEAETGDTKPRHPRQANPPYTTTGGWLTTPEFGAAGSGGAEYEQGPESD